MAEHTAIEWTDSTWNPVTGCTTISPGCKHCYAERLTERFGRRAEPPASVAAPAPDLRQQHERPA